MFIPLLDLYLTMGEKNELATSREIVIGISIRRDPLYEVNGKYVEIIDSGLGTWDL